MFEFWLQFRSEQVILQKHFSFTLGISGSKTFFSKTAKIFEEKQKNSKIGDGTFVYFGIRKAPVNYLIKFYGSIPKIWQLEKNCVLLLEIRVVMKKIFQIFWKNRYFQIFFVFLTYFGPKWTQKTSKPTKIV